MAPRTKPRPRKKNTEAAKTRRKFTAKAMIEAIELSSGYLCHAAEILGCSITTVKAYISENDKIREAWEHATENGFERLERKAYELAENGNGQILTFLLRTKGKHKGYTEAKAVDVNSERDATSKAILLALRNEEITVRQAALDFEMHGIPLPESIKMLLRLEPVQEIDSNADTYCAVMSPEEMAERAKKRVQEVSQQEADFLPARRTDVAELKRSGMDTEYGKENS